MIVNFSSTDRVSLVKAISATKTLGGRSVCDIELVPQQISGAFVPFVGQPIEVLSGGAYLFAGSVESVKQVKFNSTAVIAYSVTCTDHHRILDRRLVGQREWINSTARMIIGDVCNTNLTDELVDGVTYVNDGATIDRFVVDYVTVAEAINELAKISQYHWFIDEYKQIRFFNQGTPSAPFMLGAPCLNAQRMEQVSSREGYTNKLVVRLSTYIREAQTARFNSLGRIEENGEEPDSSQQTDGSRKFFAVTFPIVQQPRVWVDGNEETVGIDGVDSGKSWYWSKGSQSVRQDDAQTPVSASSTLYVEYIGQQTVTVSVQNNSEIDARQIIEGNSGVYESLQDSAARVTGETANDYAQSLLDQVDDHSITTTVDTSDYLEPACVSLRPGDTIQIATEGYVAGYYIVRQIRFSAPSQAGTGDVDCQFECVKGPILGDAVTFFQSLAQSEGIVATPGPMASTADATVPEPEQPDGTGWGASLGPIQPRAYTNEPEQRVDIVITRDLTTDATYWEVWGRKLGGQAELIATHLSLYPATTTIETWWAQEAAAYDYQVVIRAASASYSGVPPNDSAPWKTGTIPAITAAPSPTSWSVTLEYSPDQINAYYRGRYAFSATLPASANNAAIVTEIRPHSGGAWGPLSGYQTDPTTALQAGGTFSWNQGEFSPESWQRPESPMQWDIRLGVEDHRGIITWHSTISLLTISAGGGFQVTALTGKLGTSMSVGAGVLEVADSGITTGKVANDAITTLKIAGGAVISSKLADLAVEAAKLANSSVTATKIASAAVGSAAIAALAVGTAHIQDLAVTSAKIANLSADKITAGTITASISILSPSISISGASFTVALNTTAGIQITAVGAWSGATVKMRSHLIELEYSPYVKKTEIGFDGIGVYGSNGFGGYWRGVTIAALDPGGYIAIGHSDLASPWLMAADSSSNRLSTSRPNSYISLSGSDSYVLAHHYRVSQYTSDVLALSGLTSIYSIRLRNAAGVDLGKILVIP